MSKRERKGKNRELKESKGAGEEAPSGLRENVESILVTGILALFMISFVIQGFEIPSASMEKTLLVGDRLLANKVGFAGSPGAGWGLLPYRRVRRGDIIIFKYPFPPHIHYVKRVIAVPGDRLRIFHRDIYINGERIDEPYKQHNRPAPMNDFHDYFPPRNSTHFDPQIRAWFAEMEQYVEGNELVVPDGKYFAMGDNRDNSEDSRFWGWVDESNIVARPLLTYWSYRWFR